jgi:ABC-2 type transport system permease protein
MRRGHDGQIRAGDIFISLKPLDYRIHVRELDGAMVGNLITITVPSFVIIFGVFHANIMLGPNILFFVLTVAGSCVLSFLFDFVIGTTCFWTMSVWGISAAKDLLIMFLSGALIPLQFYPDALLGAIRYLPFAYMYNLPLTILTAGSVDIRSWVTGFGIQCAWIVAVWFLSGVFRCISMRKLTVNGG